MTGWSPVTWLGDLTPKPRGSGRTRRKEPGALFTPKLQELQLLMQDDRDRYLAEIDVQADGLADYFISFIGASEARRPWTIELINCGLAMGNIAYMYYKQEFKRVRPSVLCPGLIPPFGPPAHPAFPSGHSFLGHLIALLLLEIPALRQRYGIFPEEADGNPGSAPTKTTLDKTDFVRSPMLWLSQRLAKNRERLGVPLRIGLHGEPSPGRGHLVGAVAREWQSGAHDRLPDTALCAQPRNRGMAYELVTLI